MGEAGGIGATNGDEACWGDSGEQSGGGGGWHSRGNERGLKRAGGSWRDGG